MQAEQSPMPFLKFKRCLLAGVSLFLAVSCNPIEDVDFFADIQGTVTEYATGNPIAGATVMLIPGNQTVQTDINGLFEFNDLDPKQYTLSVQKNGYQTNRKNVNAISGEVITTVITLTIIP